MKFLNNSSGYAEGVESKSTRTVYVLFEVLLFYVLVIFGWNGDMIGNLDDGGLYEYCCNLGYVSFGRFCED